VTALLRPPAGLTTGMSNVDRLRTLRAWAIGHGYCQECRCRRHEPGRKTCRECLDRHARSQAEHVSDGLCKCGRPRIRGIKKCRGCSAAAARCDSARRDIALSANRCVGCKVAPCMMNRTTCQRCADKASERKMAAYRTANPGRDIATRRCSSCGEIGHLASRHTRFDPAATKRGR
jgi:hypothetical protein